MVPVMVTVPVSVAVAVQVTTLLLTVLDTLPPLSSDSCAAFWIVPPHPLLTDTFMVNRPLAPLPRLPADQIIMLPVKKPGLAETRAVPAGIVSLIKTLFAVEPVFVKEMV